MKKILTETHFWGRIKKHPNGGCWIYFGPKTRYGYGYFASKKGHRYAWELTNGSIPYGMWVLHKCDNPPCCNPDHLYLGNAKDNAQDRSRRGRSATGDRSGARVHIERMSRGNQHGMSKLKESDIPIIRKMVSEATNITRGVLAAVDMFGVSNWAIRDILRGRTWSHIQ